jgi:hypothetical protein
MCHDINPLGTTMHLKELDRQAERRLVSTSASSEAGPRAGQHGSFSVNWRAVPKLPNIDWKIFLPQLSWGSGGSGSASTSNRGC